MTFTLTTIFFILGAVIGSFLNVVIYRLPKMIEIEWKQSHSPEESPETRRIFGSTRRRPLPCARVDPGSLARRHLRRRRGDPGRRAAERARRPPRTQAAPRGHIDRYLALVFDPLRRGLTERCGRLVGCVSSCRHRLST